MTSLPVSRACTGPWFGPRRIGALPRRLGAVAAAAMMFSVLAAGLPTRAAVNPARSTCPADVCVSVNSTRDLGPAQLVAQGFTHGVDSSDDPSLTSPLRARAWLADLTESAFGTAQASGAAITVPISDAWFGATYQPSQQAPLPPWNNLSRYRAFVYNLVKSTHDSGRHVAFWEVQNEPDAYYGKPGHLRPTPAQAMAQFRAAADAIRAADPAARILGPSISAWNEARDSPTLSMPQFLDDLVAHHLKIDALSWHEVGARANVGDTTPDPESVGLHAARARALLAARPSLGRPGIVVSEYGAPASHLIPGWRVGWITALEGAGISGANLACWHSPDVTLQVVAECSEGALDGLFIPGSGRPQAVYYVHNAYASMTGVRVDASTTDRTLSAFATRDDQSQTLRVLLGRHQSCTSSVRVDCPEPTSATPPPASVTVHIATPWPASSVSIGVQQIPNASGPAAPPTQILAAPFAGPGAVEVPLSNFADGDAYLLTITSLSHG